MSVALLVLSVGLLACRVLSVGLCLLHAPCWWRQVLDAREDEMCVYVITLQSPSACKPQRMAELQRELGGAAPAEAAAKSEL